MEGPAGDVQCSVRTVVGGRLKLFLTRAINGTYRRLKSCRMKVGCHLRPLHLLLYKRVDADRSIY